MPMCLTSRQTYSIVAVNGCDLHRVRLSKGVRALSIFDRNDGVISKADSIDLEIVSKWIKSDDKKGVK